MAGWCLRGGFFLHPLADTAKVRIKPREGEEHEHRVSASRIQVELAEAKAAVTGLPTLVDAPALDGIDPAANEGLISFRYKVKKGPTHDFGGG